MFDVEMKQENKHNSHKKKKINFWRLSNKNKGLIIIIVSVILIIVLLSFLYLKKQKENYNNIKENKNNYLVYTKYSNSNSNYPKNIPYVNIKSSVIKTVNEDIDLFLENFVDETKCFISYEYGINGIILSLIVKVTDCSSEYAPEVFFRSYNINLSTLEVISDESLLDFFGIDDSTVEKLIESQFKNFYLELVEEEYYVPEECDYKCFLEYRNVDDYMSNLNYYVMDGNLVAYKPFVFSSIYGDEDFFNDDDFIFVLAQSGTEEE